MVKFHPLMSAAAVRTILVVGVAISTMSQESKHEVVKSAVASIANQMMEIEEGEMRRLIALRNTGFVPDLAELELLRVDLRRRFSDAMNSKSIQESQAMGLLTQVSNSKGELAVLAELALFLVFMFCVWKRYRIVVGTSFLLWAFWVLFTLSYYVVNTLADRDAYWARGAHLFPEHLSVLQAMAVETIPPIHRHVSMLSTELSVFLPLPGMTFDQWLMAEAFVCACNLWFFICCFRTVFRQDVNVEVAASKQLNRRPRKNNRVRTAFNRDNARGEVTAPRQQSHSPRKNSGGSDPPELKEKAEAPWKYSANDFLHACLYGLGDTVRAILKNPDFDINVTSDLTKDTGLHLACAMGHLPVVQMILARVKKNSTCVNARNTENKTPLMLGATSANSAIVDKLLRTKSIDLDEDCGIVPLATAVKNDDMETAEMIFNAMTERKIQLRDRIEIYITRLLALSKELASKSMSSATEAGHRNNVRVYKEQIVQAILITLNEDKSESSSEDKLRTDLEEMCECVICYEPFSGRIFACENDHWLCENCKDKNETMVRNCCPSCNVDFGLKPPRRCITAEKATMLMLLAGQRLLKS